jgi:hypothetical protein
VGIGEERTSRRKYVLFIVFYIYLSIVFFPLTPVPVHYLLTVERLRVELAAETEHSKGLNARIKSSAAPLASSSTVGSVEKSAYEQLKERTELTQELTGLLVRTVKHEAEGKVYGCVLFDARGRGLSMFLLFLPFFLFCYFPADEIAHGLIGWFHFRPSIQARYASRRHLHIHA